MDARYLLSAYFGGIFGGLHAIAAELQDAGGSGEVPGEA
jgi:hypothetical protein